MDFDFRAKLRAFSAFNAANRPLRLGGGIRCSSLILGFDGFTRVYTSFHWDNEGNAQKGLCSLYFGSFAKDSALLAAKKSLLLGGYHPTGDVDYVEILGRFLSMEFSVISPAQSPKDCYLERLSNKHAQIDIKMESGSLIVFVNDK